MSSQYVINKLDLAQNLILDKFPTDNLLGFEDNMLIDFGIEIVSTMDVNNVLPQHVDQYVEHACAFASSLAIGPPKDIHIRYTREEFDFSPPTIDWLLELCQKFADDCKSSGHKKMDKINACISKLGSAVLEY